jgi:ABC-type bacteriocin/lantibiotic exporter with double-glycine peptidase domain
MTYQSKIRNNVDHGELILLLFKDIPHVVENVFGALFPLVQDLTLLIGLVIYQVFGTRLLGLKTAGLQWVVMNVCVCMVFPVISGMSMKCLYKKTTASMENVKKAERECTVYTRDMLNNYYLLADYLNRGRAVGDFEKEIDKYNSAFTKHKALETNNAFIPTAVSLTLCAAWIMYGGHVMLTSDGRDLELGTFLAQWEIIQQMGASWQDIFETLLRIQDALTELRLVVRFMNYPVENYDEKTFMNSCAEKGHEIAQSLTKQASRVAGPFVDALPIKTGCLCYDFDGKRVLENISLDLQQGKLHLIAGRRACGKTTLLKIIGGRHLMLTGPDTGFLYVPQHLRVLHISREPLFFRGSLYQNLTYGVPPGDKDGHIDRVMKICKVLNIRPETSALISEVDDGRPIHWNEELCRSDRQILNIARGLVANPEVLCIHKPCMGLGPNTIPIVLGALKTYVDQRGMHQDVQRYWFRRPRTCIVTFSSEADMEHADEVHHPFKY